MTFLFILAGILFVAAIVFLFFVQQKTSTQSTLSDDLPHFTSPNPRASVFAHKIDVIKTRAFNEAATEQVTAARNMTTLHKEYETAVMSETTLPERTRNTLLELENKNVILQAATRARIPVQDYTKYMLKVLESETDLLKEAMSIRMTIDVAIAHSERHFALIQQLQEQIRELRLQLHALEQERLPEPVKRAEIFSKETQIKTLEARLNEHLKQTGVPHTDGQTT